MRRLVILLAVLGAIALAKPQPAPDLVIVNARVFTGVPAQAWAEAIAVKGERIAAVGTTIGIKAQAGPSTRIIDVAGRLVIPGINDAHVHLGARPQSTNLDGPPAGPQYDPPLEEVLERLKGAVARAPKGGWIFGEIGAVVLDDSQATRFVLDAVTPDNPVVLTAWTGHGWVLNSSALQKLGVKDDEPDPPGGFYVRAPGSKAITGPVHEYARWILGRRIAMEPDGAAQIAAFRRFGEQAVSFGMTSIQVMMNDLPTADAAKILSAADLPVRVRLIDFPLTAMAAWREPASRAIGNTAQVTISGTKWIMDGTPIERLMFMREPYTDRANTRGRLNFSPELAGARLGTRVAGTWMLKSTIAAGVPVALGSDGPLNPYLNVMFASINANNPTESMTREQALVAYTRGAAFAELRENEKGTIAAGMLADVAMLSQDVFTVPSDALPATTSLLNIVGGRIVHEPK